MSMGLFKRLSILKALDDYINSTNDENIADDYRVLFAKVIIDYDWKQASESTLTERLDIKFSSYKNNNKSMIESLKKSEYRLYRNITLKIHEELNNVKVPRTFFETEEAEKYSKHIYEKLENIIGKYIEK
jgi:hypothetical protein